MSEYGCFEGKMTTWNLGSQVYVYSAHIPSETFYALVETMPATLRRLTMDVEKFRGQTLFAVPVSWDKSVNEALRRIGCVKRGMTYYFNLDKRQELLRFWKSNRNFVCVRPDALLLLTNTETLPELASAPAPIDPSLTMEEIKAQKKAKEECSHYSIYRTSQGADVFNWETGTECNCTAQGGSCEAAQRGTGKCKHYWAALGHQQGQAEPLGIAA